MIRQGTVPAIRHNYFLRAEGLELSDGASPAHRHDIAAIVRQALEELAFWSWFFPDKRKYEPTPARFEALLSAFFPTVSPPTAHDSHLLQRAFEEASAPCGPLERTTVNTMRFRHTKEFAAGFIVRQWKQKESGQTTTLGEWLPPLFPSDYSPLCWVETHCPNLTGPAGELPPFRNLVFEPRHRSLLLSMVEQLYSPGDSLNWEAVWLKSLVTAPFLSDFALQCLARCQANHSNLSVQSEAITLPEALVAQRRRFAHGFSKNAAEINHGFVALAHARQPKNKAGVADIVVGLLNDTSDHIRIAAIIALSHLGTSDPDTLRMLWILARFKTGATAMRRAAVRAAANLSIGTDTPEKLCELALDGDDDPDIRTEAIAALATPGFARECTLVALRSLAQGPDDDTEVRCAALNALADIQVSDGPTVTTLQQILHDGGQDIYIREVALRVLVRLGLADADLARVLVPLLTDTLQAQNAYLRTAAIEGLTQLGEKGPHAAHSLQVQRTDRRVASRDEAAWSVIQEGSDPEIIATLWQVHWEQWKQGKRWLRASDIEKIRKVALNPVFETLWELRQPAPSGARLPSEWKDWLYIILFNLADFAAEPDTSAG